MTVIEIMMQMLAKKCALVYNEAVHTHSSSAPGSDSWLCGCRCRYSIPVLGVAILAQLIQQHKDR